MEATEFRQRDGISSNETRVLNSRSDRDDERKNRSKSARIIERTTTMLASVARTKESSPRNYEGNCSLRLFRHFKEAIYRFFVAKRRRGKLAHDRPINSVSCSSAATSSENSFARLFPLFPLFPPFPLRSSSLTQQPRKRPLLVGNFVEN